MLFFYIYIYTLTFFVLNNGTIIIIILSLTALTITIFHWINKRILENKYKIYNENRERLFAINQRVNSSELTIILSELVFNPHLTQSDLTEVIQILQRFKDEDEQIKNLYNQAKTKMLKYNSNRYPPY